MRFLFLRLLALSVCLAPAGVLADDRPNIVLIMTDDLGFSDIGPYGGEIETPHLDQLAANGLRLRQFYNVAKRSQTRATLLSGRYFPEATFTRPLPQLRHPRRNPAPRGLQDAHERQVAPHRRTDRAGI